MKKLVLVFTLFLVVLIAISACGKKILPTGALDATYTYTYTLTPTTTPDLRYDVVVFKGGNPDQGQVVSIKLAAQTTWTPVVVNPASGIASFDHISEYGKFDVKISALNTCYDDYNYQVDLRSNSVNVVNRNDAPYLEVTSDNGFETFGAYAQNITYTVKLKTDYSYPVNNITIEGLPAACAATWDTTTSDMKDSDDFIKLYITTPANYLTNITFTVKADKANCMTPNKITSAMHTISRNWFVNTSMTYFYYKCIVSDTNSSCQNEYDIYGSAIKDFTFTPVGIEGSVSWAVDSITLQTCGGQGFREEVNCTNCNVVMGPCQGTHYVPVFKQWTATSMWSHNECMGGMTIKIRFYNDRGLNYFRFYRTTNYPSNCTDITCVRDTDGHGFYRKYNSLILAGTEQ